MFQSSSPFYASPDVVAVPLYELSFKTTQPLPPIRAVRTRLQFRDGITSDRIVQLHRWVRFTKERLGIWVVLDIDRTTAQTTTQTTDRDLAIIYPACLTWETLAAQFETAINGASSAIAINPLDSTAIDLRDPSYRRLLFQHCNHELCRLFQMAPSSLVDEVRQRIYSIKTIDQIGNEVEVRRYLKFDFVCDEQGQGDERLILCLDYANEYRSLQTLNQLDPQRQPLKLKQRLTQIYNGKACEWVGWASVSIGEPLQKLGGMSLLDYHHRRGHLSDDERSAINPGDRAVLVRYTSQSDPVHHLPHLLKHLYERRDLRARDFDRYIVPIHQKIQLATQSVTWLNRQGFCVGDRLEFDTTLRQPAKLVAFNTGQRHRNLDFGIIPGRHNQRDQRLYVSEVWHGWSKRQLLERPDRIRTQVIYPAAWEGKMRKYMNSLRTIFREFGIALDRAGDFRAYDPLDRASLLATCDTLPDCDLVFAFVPTRNEPDFDIEINPYNTLKQILFDRQIPSQMVTYSTLTKSEHSKKFDNFAQNVVLGIVAKLGYIPWQIHDMPGTAEAFIGLDIGRVGDRGTVAAGCIVNAQGKLVSWASRCLGGGETIGAVELRSILEDLIVAFHRSTAATFSGTPPPLRHLVIHRDGTFKNQELETIRTIEQELRADGLDRLDLVEIVKDTVIRAATWNGQQYINPDRGFGWQHTANEAIVLTTGHAQSKVATNAAPQPLLIRRRSGDTDLMTIAEQVYWLSEMQVGSSQVVRLPMTTHFPDRIAEVTLKGLLPREVNHASRPWFL